MFKLHAEHGQSQAESGKRISVGLVRMANINPMVAVTKKLLAMTPPINCRVHFCVYHSQHPLAERSAIEHRLDNILTRHDPEAIWQLPDIQQVFKNNLEDNHLFVVLATSVAEVGRDHDYDWAIAEPSSMRSLIQLAGRIQRHRKLIPVTPNLLILCRNYNALVGRGIAYTKPGFESEQFKLDSHDLNDLLNVEQYQIINSIPRITTRSPLAAEKNLVDLEHAHLAAALFDSEKFKGNAYTALWWNHGAHWSFELQRLTPFRKSIPDIEYVLYLEEEGESPEFQEVNEQGELKRCEKRFERCELEIDRGVSLWGDNDPAAVIIQLANALDMDIGYASRRFGVLRLRDKQRWLYHPALGVHGALD
jgi:CRISPR-associated endonuclease/helicase Cas3